MAFFTFFFLIPRYHYKSLYSFLVNMGTSTEKLANLYCGVWLQYSGFNIALPNLIPQKLSKYEYTHVNSCQSDSLFFSRLRLSGCHWLPVFLAFKIFFVLLCYDFFLWLVQDKFTYVWYWEQRKLLTFVVFNVLRETLRCFTNECFSITFSRTEKIRNPLRIGVSARNSIPLSNLRAIILKSPNWNRSSLNYYTGLINKSIITHHTVQVLCFRLAVVIYSEGPPSGAPHR